MKNIPFFNDYTRRVTKAGSLLMKNRFFEQNPVLSDNPVAAISRPAMRKFAEVGTGPVRKTFSAPGAFDGDLFVVSGDNLYRISAFDLSSTDLGAISTDPTSDVSMCAVAPIGEGAPAYLFIAEGGVLWVYTDNGHARAHLQISGAIVNGNVIRLDDTYYQWTTGSLAGGLGTLGNPWLVTLGANNTEATENMYNAVNAEGVAGTTYTSGLVANPTVQATNYNSTDMFFEAREPGILGNGYESTETGANIAFDAITFAGGGADQLRQVQLPNDYGAISVAVINSFVIVVPVQEEDIKGRFYWIEPGEVVITPLNFATAERNPDGVNQVLVYGDMFWLLGENTIEPWITTGVPAAPMQRFKGILFDRGSWEGSAVQVKDSLVFVDENGAVFQLAGGQKRISSPDIEERIRRSIQIQG